MSAILDKLLKGQNVEWLPLGEALKRTKGTSITAGQMKELHKDNAPVKIFAGGKTFAMVNYEDIPSKDINNEPSIIVKSRGIIEFEYYDKPFSHKNEMWAYHSQNSNIAIKYVYYFLKTQEQHFQNIGSKMQMPQIATPDTDKFLIPIPPLNVQEEIVRILDAFTAVTAELTAELNMREKQYQYYRDKLLSFSDSEIIWKNLDEIANFMNGKGHEKDIHEFGEYIVVNSKFISSDGQVAKYTNNQICPLYNDDILIVMSDLPNGKALAKTFFVEEDNKYSLNQRIGRLSAKDKSQVLPKFLYYFLNRNSQLTKFDNGTDQTNLRKDQILGVKIPIISVERQKRIVEILDKFETLTHSITQGLPKEIALREQQYEYYREQLIDFPKN